MTRDTTRRSLAESLKDPLYGLVALAAINQGAFLAIRLGLNLYAAALNASPAMIGVLIALSGLASAPTMLLVGRWVERVGARIPIVTTGVVMTIGAALPFAWPSLPALFVASALTGLAYNSFYVAHQPLMGWIGKPEDRVRNFGLTALGISMAAFVAPLVAGVSIDAIGYPRTFLLIAMCSTLIVLLVTGNRVAIPRAPVAETVSGARGSTLKLLFHPALRVIFAFATIGVGTVVTLLFLLPLYGVRVGLSASKIGLVLGALAISMMLSRLLMARAVDRFGNWRVMTAALAVAAVAIAMLPLAQQLFPIACIACVLGLALGCCHPLAQALLYDTAPDGRITEVFSIWTMMGSLMQIAVPLASGLIGQALGIGAVFWGMAVLLAGCAISGKRHFTAR